MQQVFGTAETNPRLSAVRAELTELRARQQKLEQIYSGRKALLSQMAFVKKEIQVGSASLLSAVEGGGVSALLTVELFLGVSFFRWGWREQEVNWAIEENEKRFSVERAADLRYKELPKLKKQYRLCCVAITISANSG
eukprot:COSAG01_NODE_1122_length_11627_cov_25.881725_13_plen_138_part_00